MSSQPNNPPANPIPGAVYTEGSTGISWVWTGVSWIEGGPSGSYASQVGTGMALTPGFYSALSSTAGGASGQNLSQIATQYGASAPVNPAFGQMWVDTTDLLSPVSYVWTDPGSWTKISDGVTNTSVSSTQPTGTVETGDGWLDTTTNELKIWTGTLWQSVSSGSSSTASAIQSYAVAPAQPIAESTVYYNTTDDTVYYSTGTAWVALSSDPDGDTNSIVALTDPILRADSTALQAGDLWINSSTNTLSFYTGSAWVRVASSTTGDSHSFFIDPAPTLRPDGTNLVTGDMYVNSTSFAPYVWSGTAWVALKPLVDNDTNSILTASSPTTRANGDALQPGDLWTDSTTHRLWYRSTLSTWLPITVPMSYVQSFFGSGDPITGAIAARPGTTDALVNGDQYIDTSTGNIFYWNGTTWIHFSERHSYTGTGSPIGTVTNRPNSGGQALVAGDQYIDTASNLLYYWNGSSWTATSSTVTDTQGYAASGAPGVTAPYSGSADSNGRLFVDGDNYVDIATGLMYYRTGSAWALISTGVDTQGYAASGEPSLIAPYSTTADSNGRTFLDGDQYVNTANNQAFYRTSGAWVAISPTSDTQSFTGSGVPSLTQRPDTTALQDGDMYVDDATNTIYFYDLSATAWKSTGAVAQDTHSFTGAGTPSITQRPDATALQDGDMYVDDATNTIYFYDLSATTWKSTGAASQDLHSFYGAGVPSLTQRPSGDALVNGDQYVDRLTNRLYYFKDSAFVHLTDLQGYIGTVDPNTTSPYNTSQDSQSRAFIDGDSYIKTDTSDHYYFDSSQAAGSRWVLLAGGGGSVANATPSVAGIVFGKTGSYTTALGQFAGNAVTGSSYGNTLIGQRAGRLVDSHDNLFIGSNAGQDAPVATTEVTIIGSYDGTGLSAGDFVIAPNGSFGGAHTKKLLQLNATGALGVPTTSLGSTINYGTSGQVLASQGTGLPPTWVTGGGGSASSALPATEGIVFGLTESSGSRNVSLGYGSLTGTLTSTIENTNVGLFNISSTNITSAKYNVAVGNRNLYDLTSGEKNIVVGSGSGRGITTGSDNILVGSSVLNNLTSGSGNLMIGGGAGDNITANINDTTVIGSFTGDASFVDNCIVIARNKSDGTSNIGLKINETNAFGIPTGSTLTTAVNYGTAGQVLTSQGSGTAPTWAAGGGGGTSATPTAEGIMFGLTSNAINPGNVALGLDALKGSGSGVNNTAIGARTMGQGNWTSGAGNTCVGNLCGAGIDVGEENTLIGDGAGRFITSGRRNICLGSGSGAQNFTSGDGNIFIGYLAGADTDTTDRENTIIGCYRASAGTNQTIVLARGGFDTGDYNIGLTINENNAFGIPVGSSITTSVDFGLAGQVLVSRGTATAPTWTTGASGSFTTNDGKTVTVTDGLITNIA